MGKAHTISNQDQGTDMDIEITKNSIRSRTGKNSREAGVKIFKEWGGVKCGSAGDSYKEVLAGGLVWWCKLQSWALDCDRWFCGTQNVSKSASQTSKQYTTSEYYYYYISKTEYN